MNANKLGVTLDLEKPAGREIFKRLIKDADILIENTECSELDKLGLGYDDLKQLNPALVMTSMTVFGQAVFTSSEYISFAELLLLDIFSPGTRPTHVIDTHFLSVIRLMYCSH